MSRGEVQLRRTPKNNPMAFIQYRRNVVWDVTLEDLGYGENGLVESAVKKTTGAPTATAGKFIPAALIQNKIDGTLSMNTGSTASPVWTTVTSTIPGSNSITTAMLQAASVTLAKLAAGITPSHVVKFAGTASGGTTATRAYTITGALVGDVATAVIRASTNPVSIQKATLSSDTLTVLFSGDPGASTTVDYSVLRAAA